jgi:hypothetical protein
MKARRAQLEGELGWRNGHFQRGSNLIALAEEQHVEFAVPLFRRSGVLSQDNYEALRRQEFKVLLRGDA